MSSKKQIENILADAFLSKEHELSGSHSSSKIDGSKILVLFAGGLINCVNEDETIEQEFQRLKKLVAHDRSLNDANATYFFQKSHDMKRRTESHNSEKGLQSERDDDVSEWFILPSLKKSPVKTFYKLDYVDLGRHEATCDQWVALADRIEANYQAYDGFVILLLRENLEYLASGLSFTFENLSKTVVLTSGKKPLCSGSSDSSANFFGALVFASNFRIPEVCVYSNKLLMRGNRIIRDTCDTIKGFKSPNFIELAHLGADIQINWDRLLGQPRENARLTLNRNFRKDTGILMIKPNINHEKLKIVFEEQSPGSGLILETFGAGNISFDIFEPYIKAAQERGVHIFSATQCHKGFAFDGDMIESKSAVKVGAYSCRDMTLSAVYAKVSLILASEEVQNASEDSLQSTITSLLTDPKKGDITPNTQIFTGKEGGVIRYFENLFRRDLSSSSRLVLDDWLLPTIFFSCIKEGALLSVQEMLEWRGDSLIQIVDKEGQTAIHMVAMAPESTQEKLINMFYGYLPSNLAKRKIFLGKEDIYGTSALGLAVKMKARK